MEHQGEVAFLFEVEMVNGEPEVKIVGYTQPLDGKAFSKKELRNAYLSQGVHISDVEDDERLKVDKFFYETANMQGRTESKAQPRGIFEQNVSKINDPVEEMRTVLAGKKYKPVALKVKPLYQELPEKFRVKRNITGDPLKDMPVLDPNPPDFEPTGRYTAERKEAMEKVHGSDFLWPEEMKSVHHLIMQQNEAFAWDDTEKGKFKEEFFPPVEMPTVEHKPWVLKNIPIPPGMYPKVCEAIKVKMDAGTYESSSSSYRSKWFTVMKKDGVNFRIVHSLEALNAVTIAHSGLPPASDALAEHFSGRSCGGILDLYVGYDERLLAESSRDYTTFQTPFGALRLTTLPMGWTNSVPIFHEDVTYILRDEIPEYTEPYIDDVPIRGPKTRYELPEGKYETIPENPGIRRFVWEQLTATNRILQRMKYAGGTFSGTKSLLCSAEIVVVGHLCTYEGRKPGPDKVHVILNWGPCKTISDLRSFMGTVGLLRIYITDYATRAEHIQKLLRGKETYHWGEDQERSMELLKDGVKNAQCIKPLDYSLPGSIVLAVDTSWRAIGFYIYQEDPEDKKKKAYARFGSILLSDREQRFSQPKRELFGLLRALDACYYWLIGARKLIVETDAKYIKGMLDNPGIGPNATINRWIDQISMFHFELRHVAGKTFGPDGLSRREWQPGDEEFDNPEKDLDEGHGPPIFSKKFPSDPEPLDFEEYKGDIDTRGGYIQDQAFLDKVKRPVTIEEIFEDIKNDEEEIVEDKPEEPYSPWAKSIDDFQDELDEARRQSRTERDMVEQVLQEGNLPKEQVEFLEQFILGQIIPDNSLRDDPDKRKPYDETNRSSYGKWYDSRIPKIKEWLKNPLVRPAGVPQKEYLNFVRIAKNFFLDEEGRLYKRDANEKHKLVVEKEHRMYMLEAAHDSLGHRGTYATKELLLQRFWWPELERDVHWYVKTCHLCQERQKRLVQIPRIETHTPSIFQQLHADTMHMDKSGRFKYIVHGRCALTSWPEARALAAENSKAIAEWLFQDIICRWGCLREIITDNGKPFIAALKYLEEKYGIKGIRISAYNSKANGKVERPHWDLRQMLYKACGGDVKKWKDFLYHVLWADRITVRKGMGCSPFFLVTGAHPILPLDIQEATWLVKLPGRILTTEELIGYRAQALAKHKVHVDEMRERVSRKKREALLKFEEQHKAKIKDYRFQKGDLVLIRNTAIEKALNKKMKARYLGPMVVIRRNDGGSYIVAEMDGSVMQDKIAAFRVIPYFARRHIDLPNDLQEILDQSEEAIDDLIKRVEKDAEEGLEIEDLTVDDKAEDFDEEDLLEDEVDMF